jgi:hypothetical protein
MQVDPTIGGIEAQVGDRRGAPMQRWCRIATASAGALCWAGAEISLDHGGHAAHGLCDTWTGELLDVVFE